MIGIYGSTEQAYQKLLQDNPTDDGNFLDPITITGTWNQAVYAPHHTQSTRTRAFGGGATGGMDDRFDMILYSRAIGEGSRVSFIAGSYAPIGNNGAHYNDSINRPPNNAVPIAVANALHYASDHLPVSIRLLFPTTPSIVSEGGMPAGFVLYQNYPNPFNPSTQIQFALPKESHVRLEIFNLLGERVKTLVDETRQAGYHSERFDATGLASGLYFYRLQAGDFVATKKLLLLR
jgi:hypothetical protein